MALDNLVVHNSQGRAYGDRRLRGRLGRAVLSAITGDALPDLPPLAPVERRRAAFRIAPSVVVDRRASSRTTVVEVKARDRSGLLARLALAIHSQGHQVHSAHIATYGERAVDVFYLTNAAGRKLGVAEAEALRRRAGRGRGRGRRRAHRGLTEEGPRQPARPSPSRNRTVPV